MLILTRIQLGGAILPLAPLAGLIPAPDGGLYPFADGGRPPKSLLHNNKKLNTRKVRYFCRHDITDLTISIKLTHSLLEILPKNMF